MKVSKIKGVEAVVRALKQYRKTKQKQLERGLKKAGLFLQRRAQQLCPVDTGLLKNSAATRIEHPGTPKVSVSVGFFTSYAIFVHENLDAHHPVGQAKFLTTPLRQEHKKLMQIITDEMKKPT
jgi:hypothetical protein